MLPAKEGIYFLIWSLMLCIYALNLQKMTRMVGGVVGKKVTDKAFTFESSLICVIDID